MTSRLCSMTTIEWPASSSLRNERISLAMSSKCRPVVGSSNMKSVPLRASALPARRAALRRFGEEAGELEALRLAAGERRHRLAELHVLEADVDDRLQQAHHLAVVAEQLHRLGDGEVEDVGDREVARRRRRACAGRSSRRGSRRGSAGRRSRGSAGRRRRGTASRRARSPSRRRSGSGRCRR